MAQLPVSRRVIFFGFLLLGAVCGFFVGSLSHALAAPSSNGDDVQHNSLIVLIDDMNAAQPALEGVWLAARTGGSAEISLVPIYPLPLSDASDYSQTHARITLSNIDPRNLDLLAPVRQAGIWFDEAFVIDGAGLAILSELGGATVTGLPNAWDEPQGALQQQVTLINFLCSFAWGDVTTLDTMLALIPSHLQTTLSSFDLIARWDEWGYAGFGLSCAHPWAN